MTIKNKYLSLELMIYLSNFKINLRPKYYQLRISEDQGYLTFLR